MAYHAYSYGEVFLANEQQQSKYNFEIADTDVLLRHFREAETASAALIEAKLPLPAYEQAIKASHLFNLLGARGVISVAERAAYIGRVRTLAVGACAAQMDAIGG